jgi:hypothetical protein
VPDGKRARWIEKLAEIAQQVIEQGVDYEKLAEEEAARTDPWRWYCRLCGAEGAVSDGLGAREYRDKAAEEHLRETRCGRFEVPAREESGRLLHVWTYPRTAVAQWN